MKCRYLVNWVEGGICWDLPNLIGLMKVATERRKHIGMGLFLVNTKSRRQASFVFPFLVGGVFFSLFIWCHVLWFFFFFGSRVFSFFGYKSHLSLGKNKRGREREQNVSHSENGSVSCVFSFFA
jgi:hypothetical protein